MSVSRWPPLSLFRQRSVLRRVRFSPFAELVNRAYCVENHIGVPDQSCEPGVGRLSRREPKCDTNREALLLSR
jgi:hypothetical protein